MTSDTEDWYGLDGVMAELLDFERAAVRVRESTLHRPQAWTQPRRKHRDARDDRE